MQIFQSDNAPPTVPRNQSVFVYLLDTFKRKNTWTTSKLFISSCSYVLLCRFSFYIHIFLFVLNYFPFVNCIIFPSYSLCLCPFCCTRTCLYSILVLHTLVQGFCTGDKCNNSNKCTCLAPTCIRMHSTVNMYVRVI